MRKSLLIALKDTGSALRDPTLLILMFLAPAAVATIISVTFGGLSSSTGAPVDEIPVGIVNGDAGAEGENFGDDLSNALQESELFALRRFTDPETARSKLRNGVLTASIEIPASFTASLLGSDAGTDGDEQADAASPIMIGHYRGRPIAGDIVRSVVSDAAHQFARAGLAIRAVANAIPEGTDPAAFFGSAAFAAGLQRLQGGDGASVSVQTEQVGGEHGGGEQGGFNPLVFFGATQAIFFALFAANGSANTVLEEQRDGTLSRLLQTPTRSGTVLFGKLLGTVIMILLQLLLLFLAFTAIGSLLSGSLTFIWGRRIGVILVAVLAAALASAGVGVITAAVARQPEQASTIGTIAALFMAVVGGAFGFQVGPPLAYASVVYWGSRAFTRLAAGEAAIGLELSVMVAFGAAAFVLGLLLFKRRIAKG